MQATVMHTYGDDTPTVMQATVMHTYGDDTPTVMHTHTYSKARLLWCTPSDVSYSDKHL